MFDLSIQVQRHPTRSGSGLLRKGRELGRWLRAAVSATPASGAEHNRDDGLQGPLSLSATLSAKPGASIPIPYFLEQLCLSAPEYVPQFPGESAQGTPLALGDDPPPLALIDRRGRPAESFLEEHLGGDGSTPLPPTLTEESTIQSLRRLHEEELFCSRGALLLADEEEGADGERATIGETPFVVKLHTKFEKFADGSHIQHQLIQSQSPVLDEIASSLSVRRLARLFPARLESVRLGIENYAPQRFSGLLGYVPTIHDRMYLEMDSSTLRVIAHFDAHDRESSTHSDWRVLEQIDGVLRQIQLFPNFLDAIKSALRAAA